MNKVLIIGPIFCDLLLDGFSGVPAAGEEEYLERIEVSVGGGAITALALTQLGIPAELLSSVGDDIFGRYILNELASRGVGVSSVEIHKGEKSNMTIVFPMETDRAFLTQLQPDDCINESLSAAVSQGMEKEYSHIHITYSLLKKASYRDVIRRASDRGRTVSVDIGFDDARRWSAEDWENIDGVDFFFPNRKEAVLITGSEDMETAVRRMQARVKHPVITMGPEGAVLFNEEQRFCRIPAPDVPIRNTTGAGDSFTAGFLYGLRSGAGLEESALRGTITGSLTAASKSSVSPCISVAGIEKHLASQPQVPGGIQ